MGSRHKHKIAVVFGTRPEAIKLAPVVLRLRKEKVVQCDVCVTAQHRHMLDQVLNAFGIRPDHDLDLMRRNQSLAEFSSRAIRRLDRHFALHHPDLVLVQGDTTTVLCAALAAFYHHIPLAHVEAGLRTWNLDAPWPEEANRVLTSRLASLHFAPTRGARANLLREGVPADRIHITGNPVVDALFLALRRTRQSPPHIPGLPLNLQPSSPRSKRPAIGRSGPRVVLITGHRRESYGPGFENICHAILDLARRFPEVHFVYPLHLNPNVRKPVLRALAGSGCGILRLRGRPGHLPANVHLIEPLPYFEFVALMDVASLILTDSGGVQEEAPSLGKPVLVMRDHTERTEALATGGAILTGTAQKVIVREVTELLTNPKAYRRMAHSRHSFGDGQASRRIVEACLAFLGARS